MWIPNIHSLLFGQKLPINEIKKIKVLQKISNKFDFEKQYSSREIQHILRESGIINIKIFQDALKEYEFLQEDIYLEDKFIRNK